MKGPRDTFDIHAKNFPGANGTLAKTHGVYAASVKNKCDLNLSFFFFFFYHTINIYQYCDNVKRSMPIRVSGKQQG